MNSLIACETFKDSTGLLISDLSGSKNLYRICLIFKIIRKIMKMVAKEKFSIITNIYFDFVTFLVFLLFDDMNISLNRKVTSAISQ